MTLLNSHLITDHPFTLTFPQIVSTRPFPDYNFMHFHISFECYIPKIEIPYYKLWQLHHYLQPHVMSST